MPFRVARVSVPPLRVLNISPAVFDLGIEEHRIEGQTVRIYSLARTVADCFRFRNKVGLDVALDISLPGIDRETAQAIVDQAHIVCPYSNATRGNIQVILSVDGTPIQRAAA